MKSATKYLSQNCPASPWFVDRLIVSAFLYINKIEVVNNRFLLNHVICENDDDYKALWALLK